MKRLLGPRLPIEFAERADADITATRLLGPVPVFLWDRSRCDHAADRACFQRKGRRHMRWPGVSPADRAEQTSAAPPSRGGTGGPRAWRPAGGTDTPTTSREEEGKTKDKVRIMHSHTTRAQATHPAVSTAAARQRRLRCACRLALGRILALSRAPVVLARRLPRPLTLGLKARARAVEVLVARLRPRPRRARTRPVLRRH